MGDNVKVSVIVPVYNTEEFLPTALDSVLSQTLQDIEIVCVNDGSTDGSPRILEEYSRKDSRIIFLSQENQGAGIARNAGIMKASGKYIAFLDPDDYYPDNSILELLYSAAEENNCLVAGGSMQILKPDGNITANAETDFLTSGIVEFKNYQFDFYYQRFIFNRMMLLGNNILFPNYRRYQDPPFFVRAMCQAGRFYALTIPVYCYRAGNFSVINWAGNNYRRLLDAISGMCDELQFALDQDLRVLQKTLVSRILVKGMFFSICVEHGADPNVKKAAQKLLSLLCCVDKDRVTEKVFGTLFDSEEYRMRLTVPAFAEKDPGLKVSVIVPVYNVEKYLPECLDSLTQQTLKDFEIICVDDCTPDKSAQIMREYAARDNRVKNIFLSQNGGLAHARNEALKKAVGKYIYFVDSDDKLELDALEKLYNIAEANQADILNFLPSILKECDNAQLEQCYQDFPAKLIERCYTGRYLFGRMLEESCFSPTVCIKFFRRDLLKEFNISFIDGFIHEDNYFSTKAMMMAKKIIAINERFYIRRIRENSIMTASDPRAAVRHAAGYLVQIDALMSEVNAGVFSEEQKNTLFLFCQRVIKNIYNSYIVKISDEQLNEFLNRCRECCSSRNLEFVFSVFYAWRDVTKKLQTEKNKLQTEKNKLQTEKNKLQTEKNKLQTEKKVMSAEIASLRKSFSFRLGRALTWFPRKFRGGVRCLKEHGLIYTVKHFVAKVKKKLFG